MRIVVGRKTRLRRFKKKASLEISIQAIVIVVLAMTLLGLGLGFVRNLFGTTTDLTTQVTEQVRDQILDDLRRGDKRISFPGTELRLEKAKSKNLAVGVKNTAETSLQFRIDVVQIRNDGTETTDFGSYGSFLYARGQQTLGVNQAEVYPIKFTAGTDSDTRIFEIRIMDLSSGAPVEYASKTFFITVN